LQQIETAWKQCSDDISMEQAVELLSKLSCIETNVLEGVFDISGQSWPRLIRKGFYHNAIEGITEKSKIKRKHRIANILKDTEKGLKLVSQQRILDTPEDFSISLVQELHKITMQTSKFEHSEYTIDGETTENIILISTGEWRRRTCVTFHHMYTPNSMALVFAPLQTIEIEMNYYITEVQKMLHCLKMTPHSVDLWNMVAWIQYAFLRIHPFEDGNGRISRFLSSLPLAILGLPPVTVQTKSKKNYFAALQVADESGDLEPLAAFLGKCILKSITTIRDLPSVAVEDVLEGKTCKRISPSLRSQRSSSNSSSGST